MNDPVEESGDESSLKVAIIGGGVSGLTSAYCLINSSKSDSAETRPVEVTLFEASPVFGGMIQTEQRDGYLIEKGPDSFITSKPQAVNLCEDLGLAARLISTNEEYRRAHVVFRGKPVPVPADFTLVAPGRIGPVLKSPLISPSGKLRMGWEYFLPAKKDNHDESLASFVRRRFGAEALDRIVQPLVGGIYTSNPEKLSLQATMPRFLEMEQAHGSLLKAARFQRKQQVAQQSSESGARYGLFLSLRDGLGHLIDALVSAIRPHAVLHLNTAVERIEQIGAPTGFRVHASGRDPQNFDRILFTIPAYHVAALLRDVNGDLASELEEIPYASSAVVVSGYRLDQTEHPLDAFGVVVPAIENRKILAVSFSSRKFPNRAPKGRALLRTFVGGAMQPELFDLDDDTMRKVVRDELADLLGVHGEPELEEICRYPKSMPQYHVGHLDRVRKIEDLVAAIPGIEIAGNAFRGVGIPDAVLSGNQAAERILTKWILTGDS